MRTIDLGDVRRAIENYEQALVISREIGDRRGEGTDLGNLGNAYQSLGDVRRAIENYEQALVISREIGDRRGEGTDLGNLGIAYTDLGDVRRAIENYEQALVISREIGDRRGEGNSWATWACVCGPGRCAAGDRELRAGAGDQPRDRRPPRRGEQLGNLGNAYTAWAMCGGRSSITSRRW